MICHHLHLQNPGLEVHYNPKTKVKVTPKRNTSSASPAWLRSLKNGSFSVIAQHLYNSIPATLRELENDNEGEKQKIENLKKKLDEYILEQCLMLQQHPKTHFCNKSKSKMFCCICS